MKLSINGCLVFFFGARSIISASCISLSKTSWNSVVLSYAFRPYASDGVNHYTTLSMLVNNAEDIFNDVTPAEQLPGVFDPTNVVRLGGPPTFLGSISGVEIYNPGSTIISGTSCTPSTCLRDIGLSNPSKCILPSCHTSCSSCINNLDTGCLSCKNNYLFYQGKCVPATCAAGKFFDTTDYTCKGKILYLLWINDLVRLLIWL